MKNTNYQFGLPTALSVIIANMIGTGVFTSLGFQALGIQSGFWLLMLWIVGGVVAFLGALCYAEIGTLFPKSGGEYNYLGKIYHPSVGFLSGWVSVTVGFAGPVAATALLTGDYLHRLLPSWDPRWIATILILALTLLHALHKRAGGGFQNVFTALKVVFILAFIAVGIFFARTGTASFAPDMSFFTDGKIRDSFFNSLFWVAYAYMGWNAAAYIAGEIKDPGKNLPRALLIGTVLVTALYLLLNFVFLKIAPISSLMVSFAHGYPENTDTGHVVARVMFGDVGGALISGAIALLLVSSTSSMVLAGPRVIQAMGNDFPLLSVFAKTTADGTPALAIVVQAVLSLVLVWFATIAQIVTTLGLLLTVFNLLAIAGVIIMRFRAPKAERPYRVPFYPIPPILFLAYGAFLVTYAFKNSRDNKAMLVASGVALAAGGVVYLGLMLYSRLQKNPPRG